MRTFTKRLLSFVAMFALVVAFCSTSSIASTNPIPKCVHTFGTTSSTYHPMNRVSYVECGWDGYTKQVSYYYDSKGKRQKDTLYGHPVEERIWYKCDVCKAETYLRPAPIAYYVYRSYQ